MNRRTALIGAMSVVGTAAVPAFGGVLRSFPPDSWIEGRAFRQVYSRDALFRQGLSDLYAIGADLPHGIRFWVDLETENILVACEKLGFAITRKHLEKGIHRELFESTLTKMIEMLDDPAIMEALQDA